MSTAVSWGAGCHLPAACFDYSLRCGLRKRPEQILDACLAADIVTGALNYSSKWWLLSKCKQLYESFTVITACGVCVLRARQPTVRNYVWTKVRVLFANFYTFDLVGFVFTLRSGSSAPCVLLWLLIWIPRYLSWWLHRFHTGHELFGSKRHL